MTQPNTITIDDTVYTKALATIAGNRHLVVLDKGWIFVGNITEDGDRITLHNIQNVRSWKSTGFSGLILDPKGAKVVLDDCETRSLTFRASAEVFRVPVSEGWAK